MSFLNQLKSQAKALQGEQDAQQHDLALNTAQTEAAAVRAWLYLQDLAKQLNVIAPDGPSLSLDGKTPWPAMRLSGFRADSRMKRLRQQDVHDHLGMWWRILPVSGQAVAGEISVNFPPDLERVESRLAAGQVRHERKEIRHAEKNSLLAIRFEYMTESRGTLTLTPDHDKAQIAFRIANARGFEVVSVTKPAADVTPALLDEMAKLVIGQPNRFC